VLLSQEPLQAVAQHTLPEPALQATHEPLAHWLGDVQGWPSAMAEHVWLLAQTGVFVGQTVDEQQWLAVPAPPNVQTSAHAGGGEAHLPSAWHARVALAPAGDGA
jgi:hypothetical protein